MNIICHRVKTWVTINLKMFAPIYFSGYCKFLLQKKETILTSFKPLQRGIAACMTCPNTKVIRGVHSLLSKLMSYFPTEPVTSNVASKYEELECLYACVSKVVYEGLTEYEK